MVVMVSSIGDGARHDIGARLATKAALAGERVRDQASGIREWANGQGDLRARRDAG
jgi:hypothetical protein